MKYERLTQWVADGASLILDNPTTAEEARQQVTARFKKACIKLAELEDKIEAGELMDRDEYIGRLMAAKDISGMTDKELEFFAKHNARVRKEAVKKFAEKLKSHVILNYTMDGELVEDFDIWSIWSLFNDIDDLVEEECGDDPS